MGYSKTTELRNTKAKIKELESKVALLESDLELSDTLYNTYKRIQDETEADLNESEIAVAELISAADTYESTIAELRGEVVHYKAVSLATVIFACIVLLSVVITYKMW